MNHEADDKKAQDRSRALFAAAREERIEAPLYLQTRVLARLKTQQDQTRRLLRWRMFSLALMIFLSLASGLFLKSRQENAPFVATVDRPMAVKIELASATDLKATGIEIMLPEGVSFYSETHTSLAEERSLQLTLDPSFAGGTLPIVIRSQSHGLKEIKIRFYGSEHELISEKSLTIQFKKGDLS